MVDTFVKWFFSEVDMYGPQIHAGIFGNYIIDKILGNPITNIDLFIDSATDIKDSFITHIQDVWNIFNKHKIHIHKENHHYFVSVHNVNIRIFWENPVFRNIFTFHTLQYIWKDKKYSLIETSKSSDPMCLLKTINHVKRKKLIPLHPKYFELDHEFFLADRNFYLQIVDQSYYLMNQGWYFDPRHPRLHMFYHTEDKPMVCSICQSEDVAPKIQIACGHAFHKNCLKQSMWSETKNAGCCPNCRSPIQIFYK